MSSKKIKGITIEIGGDTSKLGKALQEAQTNSSSLQKELKQVERLLKFNPDNVELITQKQKILNDVIAETKKKLDVLKAAEKDVVKEFEAGKISEEQLRGFQREIIQTESKLKNFQSKLEETNKALNGTEKATFDARTSFDKLKDTIAEQESKLSTLRKEYANVVLEQGKNSSEAKELAKHIVSLNAELQENKQKLEQAERAANDLGAGLTGAGKGAKQAEGGFTILKGAIANLASKAIELAIGKIKDLVQNLFELSEATEEYRLMQAKLSGSAETFGYDIDFVKEKYKEFYSYLSDDQMATNAITNLEGMGVSTETVSKAADAAISVWTAYGDSIPIESLTESINESSQVAKVTGNLVDALIWAGISEDDFNAKLEKCNSTQERADLIAQTLNSTYSESKAKFDETSSSIIESNRAQLELKETQAQLGEAMQPVNTALTEMKNESLAKLVPIVEEGADAFLKLKDWMDEGSEAANVAKAALKGVGTAAGIAATALGGMLIVKTVSAAMKAAQAAMTGLNIAMSVNPIVLIVSVIAGLVVAFISLWNSSEKFRKFWIELWEKIKSTTESVVDGIVKFFTETIPNAFNDFVEGCKNLGQSIIDFFVNLPTTISDALSSLFETVATKTGEIGQEVSGFFSSLPETIQSAFSTLLENVKKWLSDTVEAVVNFFTDLPNKIQSAFTTVIEKVTEFGSNLLTAVSEAIPQVIEKIVYVFQNLPELLGYALGLALGTVVKWIGSLVMLVITEFPKVVSAIVEFFMQLGTDIWNALTTAYNSVSQWVSDMVSKALELGGQFLETVVSFFAQIPTKILEFTTTVLTGIATFVTDMVTKAAELGTQFLTAIVTFFAELPTRIWEFLTSTVNSVGQWASEMIAKAIETGSQFVNNVISFLLELPGKVNNFLLDVMYFIADFQRNMAQKALETGQQFLQNIIQFLQELPSRVSQFLQNAISFSIQFAREFPRKAYEAARDFLNNVVNFVKDLPSKVWNFLNEAISRATTFVSKMGSKAAEAGRNFLSNIVTELSKIPSRVVSIGADIIRGLWNGIQSMVGWLGQQVTGFIGGFIQGFKDGLGIASPSKVMRDEIGKWLPSGVAEGIKEEEDAPVSAFKDMQERILDEAADFNGVNFKTGLDSTFGSMTSVSFSTMLTSVYNLLSNYLPQIANAQHEIYLDSGELVGATINKIDGSMGTLSVLKERGV